MSCLFVSAILFQNVFRNAVLLKTYISIQLEKTALFAIRLNVLLHCTKLDSFVCLS